MKQKKPSSLTRILGYAGGHKNLTILGCILSALSAVLGLAPYLCVWLVARSILAAWPSLDGGGDLGRFGWMAVWFARHISLIKICNKKKCARFPSGRNH